MLKYLVRHFEKVAFKRNLIKTTEPNILETKHAIGNRTGGHRGNRKKTV